MSEVKAMTLTFDLKTFSPMPTHVINICANLHWNPSTKYRDIASRWIGVLTVNRICVLLTDRRQDGRPEYILPAPAVDSLMTEAKQAQILYKPQDANVLSMLKLNYNYHTSQAQFVTNWHLNHQKFRFV